MLTIRLQRVGRTKNAQYRLVVSEKSKDPYADSLEILGSYNPHDKEKGLVVKEDRIKFWLEKGAQTSDTVFNLLLKLGLVKGDKKKSVYITKKRQGKIDTKKEEKAAAEAKAVEEQKAKEVETVPVPADSPSEAPVKDEVPTGETKLEALASESPDSEEVVEKEETPAEEKKEETK